MGLRAIILGAPSPLSAGLVSCWLHAGHAVDAIWCARRGADDRAMRHDRRLGWTAPALSLTAIARRCGTAVEIIGAPSAWGDFMERASRLNPDVVLSLMFMAKIPADMIAAFPKRIVNLHPALLPAFGGPDPLAAMLFSREIARYSGMTLHEVTAELDAGAVIDQRPTVWPEDGDIVAYDAERIRAGGELITGSLPRYLRGELAAVPQDSSRRSYSPIKRANISLSPRDTAAHVGWLCSTLGKYSALKVEGAPDKVRVTRVVRRVGAPSGQPLKIRRFNIEMDVADARLLLARLNRLSSLASRASQRWRYTRVARRRSLLPLNPPAGGVSAARPSWHGSDRRVPD